MGIEKDIQRLFQGVLDRYEGNKAAAAASLDVNPVTFWHWVTKTRKMLSTLCKAIDSAGGKLLLPGTPQSVAPEQEREIGSLQKEIEFLTRENALLHKLIEKYETDERKKNEEQEEQEAGTAGSVPTLGSREGKGARSGVDTRSRS